VNDIATLPHCETLALKLEDGVLTCTLNRPDVRNAMNATMVEELEGVFASLAEANVRTVVLRGSGGHFCSGGDIKGMSMTETGEDGEPDPLQAGNRRFGRMITAVNTCPQTVIAAVEGAVRGGGFGLVCVSDVAIATSSATFALPETSLGIPPAQIAPFVVQRIGLTQARRLGLTGFKLDAGRAAELGVVHQVVDDTAALDTAIVETLAAVQKCAPGANAMTKRLMLDADTEALDPLLDAASEMFAMSARGPEGTEGLKAFVEKRKPDWAAGE